MTAPRPKPNPREFAFGDIEDAAGAVQEGVSAMLIISRGLMNEKERLGALFVSAELDNACNRLFDVLREEKAKLCA